MESHNVCLSDLTTCGFFPLVLKNKGFSQRAEDDYGAGGEALTHRWVRGKHKGFHPSFWSRRNEAGGFVEQEG